jgi:hypothetical protein
MKPRTMNLELFQQRLAELIEECGGRLATSLQITMREAREESFIAAGGATVGDSCMAIRTVSPFTIEVIIEAEAIGNWHHASGDDRRLNPELRAQ